MNTIELTNDKHTKSDFARMKAVLTCASKDSTRHVITKVLVEQAEEGITITGTDGRRLRCDRFDIEAEAGVYDIKVNSAKAIFLAQCTEDLTFPNYRHVIPCDTDEAAYSVTGMGSRFVLWASVALGCYLDPKLIALGDYESVTLYIQKNTPNLFPALLRNDDTTLVLMPYRIDQQWKFDVERIKDDALRTAMERMQAEAKAA